MKQGKNELVNNSDSPHITKQPGPFLQNRKINMALVTPYEPLNVLKPFGENIWIVEGPIIHMQQFGINVPFPTRMTIVRLADGSLFVHSPTNPDETLLSAIDALGPVAHLISPNKIHYASVLAWHKHYPQARCWASPGVRERAKSRKIKVHFSDDLQNSAPPDWAHDMEQMVFKGSRFMEEVVFFHKASKTLILADLIENFEPAKLNLFMRFCARLGGVLDPDGKLPVDLRLTYKGHHEVGCRCYLRMIEWQLEKIILSHGRCYQRQGVKELRRAFRWLHCH